LQAGPESPFLQIGEVKYGRPILDRGIRYAHTSLEEAAKYALLSLDSTMKSNVTVGPPVDLLAYETDQLRITHYRHFEMEDPDLNKIRTRWQLALRQAVSRLPNIKFGPPRTPGKTEESITFVESPPTENVAEGQPQQETRGRA
jgi:putative proteasome-type protease